MIKLFSMVEKLRGVREKNRSGDDCGAEDWMADPLSHPVLAHMNERQLADLPMPRNLPSARVQPAGCVARRKAERVEPPSVGLQPTSTCPAV